MAAAATPMIRTDMHYHSWMVMDGGELREELGESD